MDAVSPEQNIDTGLSSLVLLLRIYGVSVDPRQIAHQYGNSIGTSEMLRCAKDLNLKARLSVSTWQRLGRTNLPVIVERNDGRFFVLGKVVEDTLLVQDPVQNRPQTLTRTEFEAVWSGRLILMARRAGLGELVRRFDISWFLQAMHKYRHLLVEVLVASFFLQMFALVSPLFFQVVIDKVLVHRGLTTLDVLIIGLLVVSTFESVLSALRTYVFSHTTNRIDVELGARLFRHLVALPIGYFEARRAGDSVARVRELENIRNFLTSSALTLIIDLFFTFVFLAVMAYYSMFLTLIVLASFPFYIAISALVTPIFRQRLDDKFNRGAENQAFLVESITGIETLKAMAVEPQMQRKWEEQLAGYVKSSFRVLNLGNWASQGVQLVNKISMAAILFFGARAVINGDLTVGELVAFNMLSGRVTQPVLRLAQMWQDFHQARLSIARLGDILNTHPEPMFTPGRSAPPDIKGAVTFEHVTFRYKIDGPEILHDINLTVPQGQVVGIVGPSGSGKSTLTKLVQRLYVPESGKVMIDGIDLAMVDVSWLRRQVGVVLQENVLFNRSIRDNIALADPGMSIDRIVQAATLAGAHEFILGLPQGYDTNVGERGANLSGGQRQRIAIARALVTNPRILIFDEATSALDYESERIIQQNMRQIVHGRTVLIIAHRLSAVRDCHRIITIEKGRIVEDGTHTDLIVRNGRYASLWNIQGGSMSPRLKARIAGLQQKFNDIDWQEVSERFDPERITSNPKYQKFVERLKLPDYVKGPDDETEFLPAALEVVETPPSPASRIVARVIIAFFVIALLWACFGSIDIIATAQGKIVPTGRTKIIQPFETGVVHAIHVQDGQAVKSGDVLIEIDSTINEAERDRLQKEYIESELTVARLKTALDILPDPAADFVAPEGASEAQIQTQKNLLIDQVQEIRAKLDGLDQQIAQQKGNQASVQSTITKLNESIPYLKKKSEARDYLQQKGYGSKLDYLTVKQDLVEHQQDLQVQRGKLAEAMGAVASLEQQRKQAEAEWKRTNLNELTQDEQKASSLQEQLVQAAQKFRLQTLTAPVDGTVQELAIHTEGGVVTPAQILMSIVPADSHLEIEAMVSNHDIGFVRAGQDAAIKIDTFDYTKYGLLRGHVLTVSQDAILRENSADKSPDKSSGGDKRDSSEPKGQELVYAARVQLDQTQMQVDDRMVNLAPGMAVTVEIKTGARRIISYLLSPVQKHMHSALRER